MTFPSPALADSQVQQAFLKLQQGRTALLRAQYGEADRLLTEAITFAALPYDARAFALGHRGIARSRLGELRAAIQDFNAAIGLAPEDATLYNNRGTLLLEIGLYTEAAKDFDQAVSLAPDYGAAFNNRGNSLILLGDHAESLADFSKAIELMPLNAVPFNGRGRAQLALGRPAGALRDLSRAIALNNHYGQAYANRAEALIAIHRYQEAANDYSAAIDLGMATPQIYRDRAAVYAALKIPSLALADLAEARKRDPSAMPGVEEKALPDQALDAGDLATGALPAASDASSANLACAGEHASSTDGPAGLSKVVEATRIAVPTRLIYQPGNAGTDVQLDPTPALNCAAKDTTDNSEPLARLAPADADDELGLPPDDWKVERTGDGAYVATHGEHPDFRLKLEMYGSGAPDLLHWQELTDPLRGIGLLHYHAGASPQGDRLEYIAVIDTDRGRLLAIEPASWGEKQAAWTWSETTLAVVDPQGVPSLVQLNGQLSNELRLDGKQIMLKRGRRPSQHQGQIARRSRPLPYAQFAPSRRLRGYAPADLSAYYAKRVPPRFRQRSMRYPGAYAYSPYR